MNIFRGKLNNLQTIYNMMHSFSTEWFLDSSLKVMGFKSTIKSTRVKIPWFFFSLFKKIAAYIGRGRFNLLFCPGNIQTYSFLSLLDTWLLTIQTPVSLSWHKKKQTESDRQNILIWSWEAATNIGILSSSSAHVLFRLGTVLLRSQSEL